jgi:membrane-bound metal-dependent hydrolase YbcI (DUF457 family)
MTFIGHAIIGAALTCGPSIILRKRPKPAIALMGALVAAAPDLDVIFRVIGEQKPIWAHRGITHSLGFAAIIAALFAFYQYLFIKNRTQILRSLVLVFALLASHGCIDAFTNKGPRVLLFFPFSFEPIRAPEAYRIIPVSLIPFERSASDEGERNIILADNSLTTWLPRRLVQLNSLEMMRPAYMTGVILTEILLCLPLIFLLIFSFQSRRPEDSGDAPQR